MDLECNQPGRLRNVPEASAKAPRRECGGAGGCLAEPQLVRAPSLSLSRLLQGHLARALPAPPRGQVAPPLPLSSGFQQHRPAARGPGPR